MRRLHLKRYTPQRRTMVAVVVVGVVVGVLLVLVLMLALVLLVLAVVVGGCLREEVEEKRKKNLRGEPELICF